MSMALSRKRRGQTNCIPGLAILLLFAVQQASATIYQFAIPLPQFQSALGSAIAATGDDANNYVVYDVYMRAAIGRDFVGNTNLMTGTITNIDAAPPVVSPDSWTDVVNGMNTRNDGIIAPGDSAPYMSIHFTYSAATNIAVIVHNNATDGAVVGQTVNGKHVGELMPTNSQFVLDIASTNPSYVGSPIRIFFMAYADQFDSTAYTSSANKGQVITGSMLVTAELTPEPMSMLTGGGGVLLLALVGMRRRRKAY